MTGTVYVLVDPRASIAVNVGRSGTMPGADATASGGGWVRVTAFFGDRPS